MENMLSKSFLSFVETHKTTFLLVILLMAVIYQYVDGQKRESRFFEENKRLNEKNIELTFKTLEYERERSERLEFLLNTLSKNPPPITHVNK